MSNSAQVRVELFVSALVLVGLEATSVGPLECVRAACYSWLYDLLVGIRWYSVPRVPDGCCRYS